MAPHDGTPLTEVPGWKPAYVNKLATSWITTAEQGGAAAPGWASVSLRWQ